MTGELLRRTASAARSSGAELLLVSASIGVQVHPDPEVRRRFADALGVDDLLEPERHLARIADRHRIPYVPLAPALARRATEEDRFLHGAGGFGHWNRAGHAAAAGLVAEEICRRWTAGSAGPSTPPGWSALASRRPT